MPSMSNATEDEARSHKGVLPTEPNGEDLEMERIWRRNADRDNPQNLEVPVFYGFGVDLEKVRASTRNKFKLKNVV